MIETVNNIEKLRQIALEQHGFVTSSQANDIGVSRSALAMLKKRNRIDRVVPGVYRIPQVQETENDCYELALLWTGRQDASLCAETALDIWDVCDINPSNIHLAVPKGTRINKQGGENYVIHKIDFNSVRVTWFDGMKILDCYSTIYQCFQMNTPVYLLRQAVKSAFAKGLILDVEKVFLNKMIEEVL